MKRTAVPRYAGIDVPSNLDADQHAFAQAVKERLEQHSGDRGDPKERFVTMRDLELAGLVRVDVKNKYATAKAVSSSANPSSIGDVNTSVAQLNLLGALMASGTGEAGDLKPEHQALVLDPAVPRLKRYAIDVFRGIGANDATVTPSGQWAFGGTVGFDSDIELDGVAGDLGSLIVAAGADTPPTWLAPGTESYVLTVYGGVPAWRANSGAASSGPEVRGASFSGGLSTIVVPTNNVPINIREDCTITGVVVLTQGGSGNCVLDIWKSAYGAYPPTSANSICASAKPSITADIKYTDSTLSGWTTTLSAGDTLLVNLSSCSTFTAVTLFLILMPVGTTATSGYDDERARDAVAAAMTGTSTITWTYDDAANTIKGDVNTTALSVFDSTHKGVVPASGGGTTNFLRADGSFADPAAGSAATTSGTYTPTITGIANVSSYTAYVWQYMRVGNTVTVSGRIEIVTSAGATTQFRASLPVASVFVGDTQGAGALAHSTLAGRMYADTTNHEIRGIFGATGASTFDLSIHFSYLVV